MNERLQPQSRDKPDVCRNVHWIEPITRKHRAAVITDVHDSCNVTLYIFPMAHDDDVLDPCPMMVPYDGRIDQNGQCCGLPGSWHWPEREGDAEVAASRERINRGFRQGAQEMGGLTARHKRETVLPNGNSDLPSGYKLGSTPTPIRSPHQVEVGEDKGTVHYGGDSNPMEYADHGFLGGLEDVD